MGFSLEGIDTATVKSEETITLWCYLGGICSASSCSVRIWSSAMVWVFDYKTSFSKYVKNRKKRPIYNSPLVVPPFLNKKSYMPSWEVVMSFCCLQFLFKFLFFFITQPLMILYLPWLIQHNRFPASSGELSARMKNFSVPLMSQTLDYNYYVLKEEW